MKIVVIDGQSFNPGDLDWSPLEKLGDLTVYGTSKTEDIVIQRLKDVDIAITNKTKITKRVIDECPSIKYITILATGYDVVDIDYAREKGIAVSNVPVYGTSIVAQFSIALLLELCHRIGYHSDLCHGDAWVKSEDFSFWKTPQIELAGKTIGIIGFGRIGQREGIIAKALGLNVIAYDIFPNDSGREVAEYVSLDELYAKSDIISLHCNLTKDNVKMINRDSIAKMKDGVIIINDSRGQLIDEQDLCDALNSGKVYGAAVDTLSKEPMEEDNPLRRAKNCIITPHMAWAAKESRERIISTTLDNINSYLAGNVINRVN